MRNLLALLALLAVAASSVAAADSFARLERSMQAQAQSRDAFGLYRKVGRAWIRWSASQILVEETYTRSETVEVSENHAVVKTVACNSHGEPLRGERAKVTSARIEFKATAALAGEPERIRTPAGEFACIRQTVKVDELEFTFWHSTEYGGLVVKSKSPTETTELLMWWPDGEPDESVPDDAAKPEVDAYALYKNVGRFWKYKSTSKFGDMDETVSYIKYTVKSVADDHAMLETAMFDGEGKPHEGIEPSETRIPFIAAPAQSGEAHKVEMKEETIEVLGRKWLCWVTSTESGGLTSTTWSSKEITGLMVKSTTTGDYEGVGKVNMTLVLVEWNPNGAQGSGSGAAAANDPYALYRKKGRNWTMKTVVNIQGMDPMVTYMKTEVVEVAEDHAMVKFWMMDKDKKPFAGMPEPESTKIPFTAPGEPAGNPDDPEGMVRRVETIKVEAGEFECDFVQINDMKTWTSRKHPGLLVKSETSQVTSELVEYKD